MSTPNPGEAYALRRIRQAAKSSATQLDLSGLNLTTLPAEIGQLSSLQTLRLDRNQLSALPTEIGQLSSLQTLVLSENKLSALPAEIGQLSSLQSLVLFENKLSALPAEIGQLSSLQSLNLGRNQLSALPSEIGQLSSLKALYLGRNQLSALPSEIVQLSFLQILDFQGNQLSTLPAGIGHLSSLQTLTLSENKLSTLPAGIGQFSSLEALYLHGNQLSSLPAEIGELSSLKTLYLGGNQLSAVPAEIGQLSSLQKLYLHGNQLSALPAEIGQLFCLNTLYLSGNELSALPSEIGQLSSLETLYLYGNQLSAVPAEIGQLSSLQALYLYGNQLSAVPAEIGQLSSLQTLDLNGNQLSAVPSEIGQLSSLETLDLNGNQLGAVPAEIGQLSSLEALYLNGNQLSALPAEIGQLSSLQTLDLSYNRLTSIPKELSRLRRLRSLSIQQNHLDSIPLELAQLKLRNFAISKNPLSSVPRDIAAQGVKAIKAYLRDKFIGGPAGELPSRGKLILIGGAEFGKSSLLKALRGEAVTKGDLSQTHGIEINTLSFAHRTTAGRQVHLNTWDFGGQVIYHSTHQFFLSDHALFILVWSARRGVEQANLPYWLDMVESRAPNAKVVLVATHLDEAGSADLDFEQLRNHYPSLLHHEWFAVSCTERTHLDKLRQTLETLAAGVRSVDYRWPSTWVRASEAIKNVPEDVASISDVRTILRKHQVTDEAAQETLLRWLHELGEIVYYPDVDGLRDVVLLKPEWVTQQVAAILDDEEVKDSLGVLRPKHIARLWGTVELRLRAVLKLLMDHYDLTYRTDVNDERIVVECLQHKPTAYHSSWARRSGQPEIRFRYRFDPRFQPGIPTWFIARAHRYSVGHQWRSGALFEDPENDSACLLEADAERSSVWLTVRGPNPAYFFGVMKRTFADTLTRYPGLAFQAFIPCPCGGKPGEEKCKHEWDYEDALDALKADPPASELQCPKTRRMSSVSRILNGIYYDSHRALLDELAALKAGQAELLSEIRTQYAHLQNQFTLDLMRRQNELDQDSPGVFTLCHPQFRTLLSTLEEWKRKLVDAEGEELELCLYCEYPGEWHPTQHGSYRFQPAADWVADVMPYWKPLQKVLKLSAPILKTVGKWKAPLVGDVISRRLESAAELGSLASEDARGVLSDSLGRHGQPLAVWEQARGTLRALIEDLDKQRRDPATRWGGLRQTHTPSGEILWLCPEHKAKMFPFAPKSS